MVVVWWREKKQKRCPSGGGKSNVEMLVLPKRNDIKVVVGRGGGGRDKLNTIKVKGKLKKNEMMAQRKFSPG